MISSTDQGEGVLLVSDMTNRVNWGARGASLALREMLEGSFSRVGALSSRYADEVRVPIDTLLPESVALPLIRRRGRNPFLSAYYRFERAAGMKLDYIQESPEASADNIIKNKSKKVIRNVFNNVKAHNHIVVDGNGDLIFRETPARINHFNLAIVELASSLGKEVHYVNSIFSDCPATGHNHEFFDTVVETLSKCSTVTLRDPHSVRFAEKEAPELNVEYVPDSLFYWYDRLQGVESDLPSNGDFVIPFPRESISRFDQIRFDEPYVCIAGGSRAAWDQEASVAPYAELVRQIKTLGLNVYLTPTCSGDEFMYEVAANTDTPIIPAETPILMAGAIVAGARVFITGRYHPSIFASLGGTPCVFLGADSHKTRSIQDVLGYDEKKTFQALPSEEEVKEIKERAKKCIKLGSKLREKIRNRAEKSSKMSEKTKSLIKNDK